MLLSGAPSLPNQPKTGLLEHRSRFPTIVDRSPTARDQPTELLLLGNTLARPKLRIDTTTADFAA